MTTFHAFLSAATLVVIFCFGLVFTLGTESERWSPKSTMSLILVVTPLAVFVYVLIPAMG